MSEVITFDTVERAVCWLRDSAGECASARADHEHLEDWIKTVLADEMKNHVDLPLGAQEREARSSLAYKAALEELRGLRREDYRLRFLRATSEALIEVWRTLEANKRAEGKAYT